jgi:hypothetical protein
LKLKKIEVKQTVLQNNDEDVRLSEIWRLQPK